MMKCISYSLFGDPSSFEFPFYLRGIYFNARMNRILYPDWATLFMVDKSAHKVYYNLLDDINGMFESCYVLFDHHQKCLSMIQRMSPLFNGDFFGDPITHVLCRDADSVSTYREANCVYDWIQSGLPYHAINDNDAHAGLMGGLVGFRREDFLRDTGYTSFDQMISGQNLSKHGSDQNFMNKYIHPKIKNGLFMHKLKGAGIEAARIETRQPIGYVNQKLWVTDLISRYIGSAGVIDFELLRFFKSHDPDPKYDAFEKKYSDIMYWAR